MSKRKQKQTNQRNAARRPAPARRGDAIPVLPAAVALVLVAVAAVIVIMIVSSRGGSASSIHGITCDPNEHTDPTAVHFHAHVTILYEGNPATVPGNIGIPPDGGCIYWIHTHDDSGVIHVEAPKDKAKNFTLGDFFAVWGKKLGPNQVATFSVSRDQKLVTFIDGKQQPDGFDPATIKLAAHEQIVLEISPPLVDPPPSYTFQQGQ